MSILINGMEMPTSRGEYTLRMYVHSDGTATVEGSYCRFEGEPYTAVHVPPHGRLIDADALCDGLVSNRPVVIHAKCAPTIIPADPAEEGE